MTQEVHNAEGRLMMIPGDEFDRLAALEADNARLRRLLDEVGVADKLRPSLNDTVALLRAVMRRSGETASEVASYVAHLEGRLDSLMRMRARTDAFGEADLHLLVSEELMFHLVREGERATIDGPSIRLRPKAAQVLALAMHELASNAVEHGALGEAVGTVDIRWQMDEESAKPVLALVWTERGGVLDPAAPIRQGFGRELLETMLAYELGAKSALSFEPTGLRFTLSVPFTPRIGRRTTEETLIQPEDVSELDLTPVGEGSCIDPDEGVGRVWEN